MTVVSTFNGGRPPPGLAAFLCLLLPASLWAQAASPPTQSPEPTPSESSAAPSDICQVDPSACPANDVRRVPGASAQTVELSHAESFSYVLTPGAKGSDDILLPSRYVEVGGEMVFITRAGGTTKAGDAIEALDFTDVGVLRLRARRSFAEWLELYAGSSVLAKQPSTWDESIWQSALGGARFVFAKHWAARVAGAGGRLFGEPGHWWQAGPGIEAKFTAGDYLRFDLGLGGAITSVKRSRVATRRWLEEVTGNAEVAFGDHHGAFWVGIDYAVPIKGSPGRSNPEPTTGAFVEPQIRLSLQIGGVLSVARSGWDAYAAYSVVDRGELERPETTLPILDGGFDQHQLMIGVQHRFGPKPCRKGPEECE